MTTKTHIERRDEALEHTDTDGWYEARNEMERAKPSHSPEAENARAAKKRKLRRKDSCYMVDRRPPNKRDKASRKELKDLIGAIRARGNHPDHIVPWRHPQLRGLHTIENIQELPPRKNLIKGPRLPMTEAEIQAHIDAGRGVRPEHVDDEGTRTDKPGTVEWDRYPQHLVDEDA